MGTGPQRTNALHTPQNVPGTGSDPAGVRPSLSSHVRYGRVRGEFSHGVEIRAEEIALHQKFLDALSRLRAAEADGDEREVRRLRPAVERARARWLKINKHVARGV